MGGAVIGAGKLEGGREVSWGERELGCGPWSWTPPTWGPSGIPLSLELTGLGVAHGRSLCAAVCYRWFPLSPCLSSPLILSLRPGRVPSLSLLWGICSTTGLCHSEHVGPIWSGRSPSPTLEEGCPIHVKLDILCDLGFWVTFLFNWGLAFLTVRWWCCFQWVLREMSRVRSKVLYLDLLNGNSRTFFHGY